MNLKVSLTVLLVMSSLQANASLWYYNCESDDGAIILRESNKQSASDYHAGSNKSGKKWTVHGLEFLIPSFSSYRDIRDGKFGITTRDVADEVCTRLEDRETIPGNFYSIVRIRHTERVTEINYIDDGVWKTTTARMACEYVGDFSHCRGWDAE